MVDFLDFCAFPYLWKWIFNVADAFVVVGAFILLGYLLIDIIKDYKQEIQQKAAVAEGSNETDVSDEDKHEG